MPTNLSVAQACVLKRIEEVAESAGLAESEFEPLGRTKAKFTWESVRRRSEQPKGKLVLVTAVTPTPAGEGKTTVTVGLAQGLVKSGKSAMPCVREPALGPVFGVKGGATGGGYSQVLPMEDINLFFTGDFPAVAAAHNLLSAMVDSHIYHGNAAGIDPRRITFPRTVDMNDRALRSCIVGVGRGSNGAIREEEWVITPASEVMAILGLSSGLSDLKARLGQIMVGQAFDGSPVYASALEAQGAMAMLLKDALRPNLVQTVEGIPAIVHGGPFANIATGTNTILATRTALGLADWVVTEAGFASDLGAEKFMHIVSPALGRTPDVVVLVATVRALKYHGGGDLAHGLANLGRHLLHLRQYGLPVVVAVNKFTDDTAAELEAVVDYACGQGAVATVCDPWNSGGPGCTDLAEAVATAPHGSFQPILTPDSPISDKLDSIVKRVYGGAGVNLSAKAKKKLAWGVAHGLDKLPVCVAKTQNSLSADPKLIGAPTGFTIEISDIRYSTGAGFAVAVAGEMMLMPGLGKVPAAVRMDIDEAENISGLN